MDTDQLRWPVIRKPLDVWKEDKISKKTISRIVGCGAIWICRHGNRIDFVDPSWQGTDPYLADDGIVQAKETGIRLREEGIQHIFASPFLRTIETAHHIAEAVDLSVKIEQEGAVELARRSRGTPRVANRILRRTRDYAEVKADGVITKKVAMHSLEKLGIDGRGLDDMDRLILSSLVEKFGGGPVGINSLSVAIGEDPQTIEDVYEPFLIKEGFIQRTPRGRIAEARAFSYLGVEKPENQPTLFE